MSFQRIEYRGKHPGCWGWLIMLQSFLWATSSLSDEPSRVEVLLSRAGMGYWMGMEEGGDTALFREGLNSLKEAAELVESMPEEKRGNFSERISSLRVELDEQLEIAHDTINGTLPLLRYMTGRGTLNEWVDDPWIMGAVRGASALSETAARYWMPLPQLDVVYGSSVKHLDDESVLSQPSFHPALENEMAYVFNLNSRFFNHNRTEVLGAMNGMQWKRYQTAGMDEEHARVLASALSLNQVLEVRLQELHVEDPLWFYQISGRLRNGATGDSEATVFAFGMVRDRRARLPWLPLAVFLPCLLATLAANACHYRVSTAAAAFLLGACLAVPLLWILSPRLALGELLLVAHWWAPFSVALGLLIIVPILFVLVCRRVSLFEQFYFFTAGRRHASAFGIAAVPAAIVGFAGLSCLPAAELAVWLAILAWLAFLPLPVMLIEWAGSGSENLTRERVLAVVTTVWFGTIWWLVPESDKSFAVNATLATVVGSSIVAILFAGRGAFVALLFLSAGGSFGAALTGNVFFLLPWSLAGILVLFGLVIRSRGIGSRAALESVHATGAGNWPGSEWPYFQPARVGPAERFLIDFAGTEKSVYGRHLHIEGREGSGKSRVIVELLRDDRLSGSIFSISCAREKDGRPFEFLVRGFAKAGEQVPSWLSGDRRLAVFDQVAGSAAWILPGADMISGMMPEDEVEKLSPDHVASWVAYFFEERSKETGLSGLLWIDDAGNLSDDERDFAGALLDQAKIRGIRLMLITASRTESNGNGLRLEEAVAVHLDWNAEELGRCLESVLARECIGAMMEKTSIRVPGFFINWAEELVDQGVLERGRRGWMLTGRDAARDLDAPENILEIAGASVLKEIDNDCLDLLRVAASDGTTFHAGCVAQSAGRSIEEAILLLERCEDRGIVVDLPEDRWFRFRDDLVREFLWTKTRREGQDSHRQRYALALEEMARCYRELSDAEMPAFDRLVRSAGHYESAGTVSEEAVRCRMELVREALDRQLFAMAAQKAEALLEMLLRRRGESAPVLEAGTLYLRSLSLRSESPASRGAAGNDLFDRLLILIGQPGFPEEHRVALACEVARTLWRIDKKGEGLREENLDRALRILEGFDADAIENLSLRIRLWHYRGRTVHLKACEDEAKLREADELFCKALRIEASSTEAKRDRAETLTSRVNCLNSLNGLIEDEAIQCHADLVKLLDESIAIKRELGDRLGEAFSLGAKGRLFLEHLASNHEHLEEALRCFEMNESISRETGNIKGEVMMPSLRGRCLFRLERYEESVGEYRRALEIAERFDDPCQIAWARLGLVEALKATSTDPEVLSHERQALALAAESCEDPHFRSKRYELDREFESK